MKNYKKGSAAVILLIIVLLAVVVGYVYFKKSPGSEINIQVSNNAENTGTENTVPTSSTSTQTNTKSNTNNGDTTTLVSTTGWKRYDSGRGFEFKHPTTFTLDNTSTGEKIIFTYNDQGQRYFVVTIDEYKYPSLEALVKDKVATLKADSAQAATPVTVSYKATTIGSVSGYLITSQAGDVLKNTDAIFMVQKGISVFSFKYSYPATTASQSTSYNQIQTIISTFKYF